MAKANTPSVYFNKDYIKRQNPLKEKIKKYDKIRDLKSMHQKIRNKNLRSRSFRNSFAKEDKPFGLRKKQESLHCGKEKKIINKLDLQIKSIAQNLRNLKVSQTHFFNF